MPYRSESEEPGPRADGLIWLIAAAIVVGFFLVALHWVPKEQSKELPRRPDVNPHIWREVQRESDETQMIMIYGVIF
jgi:hypothetical protein